MTCIGNSGPLPEELVKAVEENDLVAVGVLSGNRYPAASAVIAMSLSHFLFFFIKDKIKKLKVF